MRISLYWRNEYNVTIRICVAGIYKQALVLIPDREKKMQNATVKSEHLFLPNTFALCLQKA